MIGIVFLAVQYVLPLLGEQLFGCCSHYSCLFIVFQNVYDSAEAASFFNIFEIAYRDHTGSPPFKCHSCLPLQL